jgi:hypothetical protein
MYLVNWFSFTNFLILAQFRFDLIPTLLIPPYIFLTIVFGKYFHSFSVFYILLVQAAHGSADFFDVQLIQRSTVFK